MPLITQAQFDAEDCRRSLLFFVQKFWHIIEPKTPFKLNWHIEAICDHLEAVHRREIQKLLINIPPGMMKSGLCSVMFPAWTWISQPEHRFLCSTYSHRLSIRDAIKMRRIVDSPLYHLFFGHFQFTEDQNTKEKFENNMTGCRISTSVGGLATGERGDTLMTDDPHNALEIHSDTKRQAVIDWWKESWSTRLNNESTGARIVIMQRLHEKDLSGYILEKDDFEHLCLPMEYVPTQKKTVIGFTDPRTKDGELLFPEMMNEKQVADKKIQMGSIGYSGQMQQSPVPAGGNIIREKDFRFYKVIPEGVRRSSLFFDMSFEGEDNSDFNVGMHWGKKNKDFYLMPDPMLRGLYNFPQAMFHVEQFIERITSATKVKIEKKANGHAALQVLRKKYTEQKKGKDEKKRDLAITEYVPKVSKQERLYMVQPFFEAGQVWFPDPEEYPWVRQVIKELLLFPKGEYDDCVDVTTMAILDLMNVGESQFETIGQRKYG